MLFDDRLGFDLGRQGKRQLDPLLPRKLPLLQLLDDMRFRDHALGAVELHVIV